MISTGSAGLRPAAPNLRVPSRDGPGSTSSAPPWRTLAPSGSSGPPFRRRWKTRCSCSCSSFSRTPRTRPGSPFGFPGFSLSPTTCSPDADTPPDAAALSLQIVGDEYDHCEVPDKSGFFDLGAGRRESLERRWNDLEAMLARAAPGTASFHPLTRRFFVKALREHGVDEILANLSCLEADAPAKGRKGPPRREAKIQTPCPPRCCEPMVEGGLPVQRRLLAQRRRFRPEALMVSSGSNQVGGRDGGGEVSRLRG